MSAARSIWRPLFPVPEDAPEPRFEHAQRGSPLRIFTYKDLAARALGHACWFRRSGGEWAALTLTFCISAAGARAWRWLQFPRLRPLYGQQVLGADPEAKPLLVFSELAAEAVRVALPEFAPVSWPGGPRKVSEVDWSPLRGKLVAIWPPAGEDGHAAALRVVECLKDFDARAWALVQPKSDDAPLPPGWDAATAAEQMSAQQIREWFDARLTSWRSIASSGAAGPQVQSGELLPDGGTPGDPRPVIEWAPGRLPQIVDAAEAALMAHGPPIYQRSGMLVRVMHRDVPSVRNYQRRAGTLGLAMVDAAHLTELFTSAAQWRKWSARTQKRAPINAPDQVASTYIARAGHWRVPRLWSVISAPTLRPDGSVLQQPGYDAATQTWFAAGNAKYPPIPERPSREQAEVALAMLTEAFATFPFEQEVDLSVALALALTALVRRSLPAAPLGAITAPVMGSGKTLLADCIAILAMGAAAPAMKYADSDEEAAKTALAVLMEGDAVVLIDNIERPLQGDWLCSILTSESFRQRVLGRTEMVSVPTSTLFLATGNQLVIAGDLRTRALMCRIDPKIEHPEERAFAGDLREWFMAQRPELVVAGLTVMRWFAIDGEPGVVRPFGRFEAWSEMVRAPLVALGMQDPCASVRTLEADDPERGEHLRVMHAWFAAFADEKKTAREAVELAVRESISGSRPCALEVALREVALDRANQLSSRRLAKWLQRHAGRRIAGRWFAKAGEVDHAALWKVEVTRA